jgi:hypothetical protein
MMTAARTAAQMAGRRTGQYAGSVSNTISYTSDSLPHHDARHAGPVADIHTQVPLVNVRTPGLLVVTGPARRHRACSSSPGLLVILSR